MENYINNQLSYSEVVELVAKLSEESKIQPDYAENDPTKKSHILNRLCYETGEPAKIYTTESYSVPTESFLVSAGLCSNEIINEADLNKYSILVELRSGKTGAAPPTTVEYKLSQMKATKTYYNGTLVGCKYTINVGRFAYADARIYVINNYVLFNELVIKDNEYQTPQFSGNGVYLCQSVSDTFDPAPDNEMYSTYVTVKNLTRISTIKIHRLPNRFISLHTHKDFKALKETVEGISFDTLPDKPFSENYLITETITNTPLEDGNRISFDGGGTGNWEAYQVSRSTYTKEQLLGGKCYISNLDYFIIDESHIVENTDDGLTVLKKYGVGTMNYYIWVAYTKNYQPEGFDSPLPAIGLYFSVLKSDYESLVIQQLDLEYIGIKKLDNMFLDLPKNEDFKELKNSIPTVPTNVSTFNNDANYVNETQLINKVSEIVANAPEDFDTLKEMSDWIASHRDSASQMNSDISSNSDRISTLEGYHGNEIINTRGTGTAYVATVPSITELKQGVSFLLTPHTNNTANYATLNVNGLGEKYILRSASDGSVYSYFGRKNFFNPGRVYRMFYENGGWVLSDYAKPNATDLSGVVPTANGGVPTTSADNVGKVLTTNASGTPEWQTPSASGESYDIVVPAKGSRGQANFVESIPGLLKLYNESCGLGVDNYGQVGVVAATNQDIDAGTSMRKPIVPATFAYALSIFGLHFRVAIVEKNDTFAIKPGMIALVHPWDKASFYTPDGTAILTNAGMSFIFSSEPVDSSNNYNANGDKYWMSVASISGFSSTSKHNSYSTSSGYCYFKNAHSDSSGSGRAYIYYIG